MSPDATPASPAVEPAQTQAGNYFVSNYPPFSFWKPERVGEALAVLERPPDPRRPLGLYVHIPFCRRRCHFCYFRVYTDKNASEINAYLDALEREFRMLAAKPFVGGRTPRFVYFGGGTPSYLSPSQLRGLTDALKDGLSWEAAEEVTFECEPGTLNEAKLRMIREIGVTRLSLGIEHFDDSVLELNGRAHRSKEIFRAYEFARSIDFPQINIDLIAGMMGETDELWRRNIDKVIELAPDCVTIYQMEVPYNTTIYQQMREAGKTLAPVAEWETKRRWVGEAFAALEAAGYAVTSAYTAVRDPACARFVYRDSLWTGADLLSIGVASFGFVNGVHMQNEKDLAPYIDRVNAGEPPIHRALGISEEEQFIRQLVLQFKLGRVSRSYFQERFGVDVERRFAQQIQRLAEMGLARLEGDALCLSRDGLLKVDWLVREFFLPQHRGE